MVSRLPDDWVPPRAAGQYGIFTRAQALAAGATPAQVRRRRETGRWRVVAGDGLMLAPGSAEPWRRAQAAGLTWPDAVVCLGTAALLHHLPVPDDGLVHVILPVHRESRGAIATHRLPLAPGDIRRLGLLFITTLERTLFDCVGRLPLPEAERLVTWAGTRDLVDAAALQRRVARRPGAWGNAQRRQAVADLAAGTYNAAERRLQGILRRAGIVGWEGDQRVTLPDGTFARADVLFRAVRLLLEVDGFEAHGRTRFQADRTRQNALVAAGYTLLRFTWWDLVERPDAVARLVRVTLGRLRAPGHRGG